MKRILEWRGLGPVGIALGLAQMVVGQILIGGTYPVGLEHPGVQSMAIGCALVLVGVFIAPSPWRQP